MIAMENILHLVDLWLRRRLFGIVYMSVCIDYFSLPFRENILNCYKYMTLIGYADHIVNLRPTQEKICNCLAKYTIRVDFTHTLVLISIIVTANSDALLANIGYNNNN